MSDLSVLILCGRSPRHLYVANRLCRAARPLAIVHETGTQWTSAKLAKAIRPGNLSRKGWRWLRDRRRYVGGGEAKFLFGEAPPSLDRPDLVVDVPHVNDPRVVDLAERTHPDVIAVFGTSLIRGPLLNMGRLGIVNLHGGLSPQYRGADCTFWALYNGEPEQVGCTIHYIDAGIDTGKLIAHVSPEIRRGDDELTLFWRAVRDSADVYAELFERLDRGERVDDSSRARAACIRSGSWTSPERELERSSSPVARECQVAEAREVVRARRRHGGGVGSGEGCMRDIAVTVAVFGLLPFIIRRPWIGILVWTWLGFMNPHRLAWGFAVNLQFAMIVALTTLVAILISREPKKFHWEREMVVMAIFMAWMVVTTFNAIFPPLAWEQFDKVAKIFLMIFVAALVINTRERLIALVWVIALSIGFYGVKGGISARNRRWISRTGSRAILHRGQ
jgi:hypothetical protein